MASVGAVVLPSAVAVRDFVATRSVAHLVAYRHEPCRDGAHLREELARVDPLTFSYTLGGGNSMKVAASSGSAFRRELLPVADASGRSYYASFLFRAKGGSGALPNDASSPFLGVQALDATPNYANDSFGIFGKGGKAGARVASTDATFAASLAYDQTYFAVVQYRGWNGTSYQTATLWLNPTINDELTTSPAIKVSSTVTGAGLGSDGFLGLAARTVGLSTSSYYLVDELRIGRSWTEVASPPN